MAFLMMDLQIGGLNVINKKKYEENFMLSDRDDTVSEDNDSVGVDCYCPNCGALYSIVEHKRIIL